MTRLPVRADGEVELPVHDIDVAPLCVVRNVVHGGSVHSSLHTQKYIINHRCRHNGDYKTSPACFLKCCIRNGRGGIPMTSKEAEDSGLGM